jgi:hypothetical protein
MVSINVPLLYGLKPQSIWWSMHSTSKKRPLNRLVKARGVPMTHAKLSGKALTNQT